jgi:hypothetical protein
MNWVGGADNNRILALVYYDASTQEWHIGDTTFTREMVENSPYLEMERLVCNLLQKELITIVESIVDEHKLKDVIYGW